MPKMDYSGLDYGKNKAVNDQQSSAPVSSEQGGGGAPARGGPPGFGPGGAFSPTQRPGEPMTAGTDFGPGVGRQHTATEDPFLTLQAIYHAYPSPQLERLLAKLATRRA